MFMFSAGKHDLQMRQEAGWGEHMHARRMLTALRRKGIDIMRCI